MNNDIDIQVASGQIRLREVKLQLRQLPGTLRFDEIIMEIGASYFHQSADSTPKISVDVTAVTLIFSEVTLNAVLREFLPTNAPVREMQLRLLSGKIIAEGKFLPAQLNAHIHFLPLFPVPFTAEVTPKVTSPTKVQMELTAVRTVFALPEMAVQRIQHILNETPIFDLSKLPLPIALRNIQCEPGRLSIHATAQFAWPLDSKPAHKTVIAPFESHPLSSR